VAPAGETLAPRAPLLTAGAGHDRMTLADAVHRRMQSDIVSGRLLPDERLTFELLRKRYDTGIAPLREALQRLVSESLVVAEGHVGFKVAPISLADLQDINALRVDLEVRALRASIARGDLQWEARIVAAAHQLSRTPIPVDPDSVEAERWEEQHRQFHDALISACPSRWNLQFCRTLFHQFGRYRRVVLARYWSNTPTRSKIDAEHERLVKAVLARDADAAARLLATHYGNSANRIVAEFERLHGP
jgi:DNA-binding GntR family transcriptional regulator